MGEYRRGGEDDDSPVDCRSNDRLGVFRVVMERRGSMDDSRNTFNGLIEGSRLEAESRDEERKKRRVSLDLPTRGRREERLTTPISLTMT